MMNVNILMTRQSQLQKIGSDIMNIFFKLKIGLKLILKKVLKFVFQAQKIS